MNVSPPQGAPRAILLTPRDWELIALREASMSGCALAAAAKMAESKRYGLIATEIERLRDAVASQSEALQSAYRAIAFMRTALASRAKAPTMEKENKVAVVSQKAAAGALEATPAA